MTDERITRLEARVDQHGKTLAVLDERQSRMHEDMGKLTAALENNTQAQNEFNRFIENKRGFLGGIIATLSVLSGVMGALIAATWNKFVN